MTSIIVEVTSGNNVLTELEMKFDARKIAGKLITLN